jgi:transcriptional regulator with XRE-family HTH domain
MEVTARDGGDHQMTGGDTMRPTVRSRRLGKRLSTYREGQRLSGTGMATQLGINQGTWSKIESGTGKVSQDLLDRIVEVLSIPGEVAAQLDALRQKVEEPGWWQTYGEILSDALQMLIELEADASSIRTYHGDVIPGLLQIRDYAKRIITAGSPYMRTADMDRYLELRMRRQKRLSDGVQLTAIVGEAAIRQQVGGRGTLRAQLLHIVGMIHEHNVTVRVVPFSADAHAALGNSFEIIEWPDETDPQAVYVDGVTSWTMHDRGGEIASYIDAVASAEHQALLPQESLNLINYMIKELG